MYVDPDQSLDELARKVSVFTPAYPHDAYIIATIEEAIDAAREGNFGVGAIIVNCDGEVVQRGHNHVFHPYFRSDIHAEMDAMSKFEESFREAKNMRAYTLFTSLEPCPMCLTRLITSGIGQVYYAAPDVESGMVSKLDELTPVWVGLAESQDFRQAKCSQELSDIALQVFLITANHNTRRLHERRGSSMA